MGIYILLLILLLIGCGGADILTSPPSTPTPTQVSLWEETVVVEPRTAAWEKLLIDVTGREGTIILGEFVTTGGGGNDIELLILDDHDFINFQNDQKDVLRPLYRSGVVTTKEFEVPVPETGEYYVVLDNQFSLMSNKVVQVTLSLRYTTMP